MNISFIFPSDSFNPKMVDEFYLPQAQKLMAMGFHVFHLNTDEIDNSSIYQLTENNKSVKIIREEIDIAQKFIYRGWMLNQDSYNDLTRKLYFQLMTDKESYLFSHHLPNWYKVLENYTMSSIVTNEENIKEDFLNSSFEAGFIKDYVKSIKTGKGSIVESEADLDNLIQSMKQFKGNIEGGLVIRQKTELMADSETRYFVLNGEIFSPTDNDDDKFKLAKEIQAKLSDKNLFFYSIDIAYTQDNKPILVEIGDGQVSDYTGWEEDKFIQIFKHLKPQVKMKLNG